MTGSTTSTDDTEAQSPSATTGESGTATATATRIDPTSARTGRGRQLGSAWVGRYGVVIAWVIEIAVFGILEPHTFLTVRNFKELASSQADLLILSLAVVPSLAVGEIDLSIAAVMALAATLVGQLNGVDHWSLGAALVVAMFSSLLVGVINGVITVYLRVRGIIVTLGMGTLVLGVTLKVSHSLTVSGVSFGLQKAMNHLVGGISASFFYALIVAVAIWYFLRHTPAGRWMLFLGFNREVARLSGINVSRLRLLGFALSSSIAGFAGVVAIGVAGGADPSSFQPLLLPAFAATFLGSLIFTPGRVHSIGNVVALYFLATGIVGLELMGVGNWIDDVFYGAALVATLALSGLAEIIGLRHGSAGH